MQEYYLNSEKKICLMELSEFKELEGAYPHKRNLFRSMNPVQYCKAESYGDCLFGTMKIPRALKGRVTYIVFGFYLRGRRTAVDRGWQFPKDVSWKAGKNYTHRVQHASVPRYDF